MAHVMGKVIVIVPAVLVVALALYTGYAMSAGMGMSKSAAWLSSIGSLAFTGVMLAVIIWIKRNRV